MNRIPWGEWFTKGKRLFWRFYFWMKLDRVPRRWIYAFCAAILLVLVPVALFVGLVLGGGIQLPPGNPASWMANARSGGAAATTTPTPTATPTKKVFVQSQPTQAPTLPSSKPPTLTSTQPTATLLPTAVPPPTAAPQQPSPPPPPAPQVNPPQCTGTAQPNDSIYVKVAGVFRVSSQRINTFGGLNGTFTLSGGENGTTDRNEQGVFCRTSYRGAVETYVKR